MKRICRVKPSKNTCYACVDMQESCNVVKDCGTCGYHKRIYEIVDFIHGLFASTYALVLWDGKIEKVPINRLYDIREVSTGSE